MIDFTLKRRFANDLERVSFANELENDFSREINIKNACSRVLPVLHISKFMENKNLHITHNVV